MHRSKGHVRLKFLTSPFIVTVAFLNCIYDNLVAYDHGFIISVSVTIIVEIGFVKIVSKLMLLFLIHLLRFLLCVAQSKDCANSYIARNIIYARAWVFNYCA